MNKYAVFIDILLSSNKKTKGIDNMICNMKYKPITDIPFINSLKLNFIDYHPLLFDIAKGFKSFY